MKIVLSCGGTGGHIYPALAIAERIKKSYPGAVFLFIGKRGGMEERVVAAAGYEIKGVRASGFNRKDIFKNFKTLSDFLRGRSEALSLIKDFKPDFAIGTGGYVSGVVLSAVKKAKVKYYIQEQNVLPGMANRFLAKGAEKIFISYEESRKAFKKSSAKCVLSGSPVRSGFLGLTKEEAKKALGLSGKKVILATGGSLGAEVLDGAVLNLIKRGLGPGTEIIFITGERYFKDISEKLKKEAPESPARLVGYSDDMPRLMAASDLVISRAGALALSEICALGRASVLVPSPNVTGNHQFYNAKALAEAGAAILTEEKELSENPNLLYDEVKALLDDGAKLSSMSKASLAMGRPGASDIVFKELGL